MPSRMTGLTGFILWCHTQTWSTVSSDISINSPSCICLTNATGRGGSPALNDAEDMVEAGVLLL